jgi:hypothetical protein
MSAINRSVKIARGFERQINIVVSTGEIMDVSKHARERIGTVFIMHRADGRVSISMRDISFEVNAAYPRTSTSRFDRYSYTARQTIARDGKTQLRASHRDGKCWIIELGKTGNYICIQPGAELTVMHNNRVEEDARAAA